MFPTILSIYLLLYLSTAHNISSRQFPTPRSPLNKRAEIEITGLPVWGTDPPAPIIDDDIDRYIDQIAEMSQLIVDKIHSDDAIFLQWFGDPAFYFNVIDIYNRIAKIKENMQYGKKLRIEVINEDRERSEINARATFGEQLNMETRVQTAALYMTESEIPTIRLYKSWKTTPSFLDVGLVVGGADMKFLDKINFSRQGILFHELAHFVGDSRIFPPVMPGGNNVDTKPYGATRGNPQDIDFLKTAFREPSETKLEEIGGYDPKYCLPLPQLKDGPIYAIHNADTYSLFAFGWNSDRVIRPTYGKLGAIYKNAIGGDPLFGIKPPFRNMGRDSDKVFEWWRALKRRLPR
ncbi:hypothetical protein HYFRA_00007924 [Hymenoscyphus fraxineus]|uniref:Uncharacterized protein n=1 Tax=Hymenoscyphus fraxineus TaxID=746836 RepID=A0A9N9KR30_9HELO|nr:hypothetical protein HYFRA_00007924 [Hymenoscyphus fraxineus]